MEILGLFVFELTISLKFPHYVEKLKVLALYTGTIQGAKLIISSKLFAL